MAAINLTSSATDTDSKASSPSVPSNADLARAGLSRRQVMNAMTAIAVVPATSFSAAAAAAAGRVTFDRALLTYQQARRAADALQPVDGDDVTASVDEALDRLLRTKSPDSAAFQVKLRVLEREYGRDWQPRHVAGLLSDAEILGTA